MFSNQQTREVEKKRKKRKKGGIKQKNIQGEEQNYLGDDRRDITSSLHKP